MSCCLQPRHIRDYVFRLLLLSLLSDLDGNFNQIPLECFTRFPFRVTQKPPLGAKYKYFRELSTDKQNGLQRDKIPELN